jgi:preprotein translocase subunit SecA
MLLLQMQLANKWNAAEITWDMIHYDVQLIGGMVYEGKSS